MPLTLTAKDELKPAFESNNYLVLMSIDEYYAPYCSVCAVSLAQKSSEEAKFDIVILEDTVSDEAKEKLSSIADAYPFVSIRFINMTDYAKPYLPILSKYTGLPMCVYFRLFTPIFKNYDRALYLDGDTLVEGDVRPLFSLDLQGKLAAAAHDFRLFNDKPFMDYAKNTLGLAKPDTYCNSGVILYDLVALRKSDFFETWLAFVEKIGVPKFPDQCAFNVALENRILFLDQKWNHYITTVTESPYRKTSFENAHEETLARIRMQDRDIPVILHLLGARKPWLTLQNSFSERFWTYAEKSPYFDELVTRLMKYMPKYYDHAKKKRMIYAFASLLPLGKKQEKWQWKWDAYNYEVLACERFMKKYNP